MKNKHTPGPWHINTDMFWRRTRIIMAPGGKAVAQVSIAGRGEFTDVGDSRPEEADANAKLIASAPQLLAQLERMVEYYRHGEQRPEALENIRCSQEVIARAKGES